jgi:hypothetical protein
MAATAPQALSLAAVELRDDKELVLPAVSQDPKAFEYASPRLQNDKEVLIWGLCCSRKQVDYDDDDDARFPYKAFCTHVREDNIEIRRDKEVALSLLATTGKIGKPPGITYQDILCEFSEDI